MMDILREEAAKKVRQARSEILCISTSELTIVLILTWFKRYQNVFAQAESAGSNLINVNMQMYLQGHASTTDVNFLDALRMRCIKNLDSALNALNQNMPISANPIPDEIITKIKDQKLSTLLREFNNALKLAPNLSSIGYRTIISLVLKERAKISQPVSNLATKQDIGFEPDIKEAINLKIVSQAEEKILKAYLNSDRISFDNVTHKAGDMNLVEATNLEAAIKNLNTLLRTII